MVQLTRYKDVCYINGDKKLCVSKIALQNCAFLTMYSFNANSLAVVTLESCISIWFLYISYSILRIK